MDPSEELTTAAGAVTLMGQAPMPGLIGGVDLAFSGTARTLPAPPAYLVHGWLLDAIARADPACFDHLHHRRARRQPFTIAVRTIEDGLNVRITWICGKAAAAILAAVRQQLNRETHFADRTLRLASASEVRGWEHQPPSRQVPAGSTPAAAYRTIALRFVSPTMFRHQGHDLLFPEPRLVFGSLVRSWNESQSPNLDPTLVQALLETAAVSRFRLATTVVPFPRFPQRGFTGSCEYSLVPWNTDVWRLARFLGEFASFAGVGYKASMGMGEVEIVPVRVDATRMGRGSGERRVRLEL